MRLPRTRLEGAFSTAVYTVHAGDRSIVLHLDRANLELRTLLPQRQSYWALIGAVNPGSRAYPGLLNQRRHQRLQALIRQRNWICWPASGHSPDQDWHEVGFWLSGLGLAQAQMLARRFAQAALLEGIGTGPARLRWLE